MKRYKISDFDTIRPYKDSEIQMVFNRLKEEEAFQTLLNYVYPDSPPNFFMDKVSKLKTIREFQEEVISDYVKIVIKNTTQGITFNGFENLTNDESYLYISNHRDILLDPAILDVLLVEKGFDTTEIAIGDNLLIYPWIIDLVKLNRTFIVNRNLPAKQMLESSKRLSNYIRYTLSIKKNSIWIAQREGRSKDGTDLTQVSLLKMLNYSGIHSFVNNFMELKIVPVSISYEYDPCDYLKAMELLMKKKDSEYKKTSHDDLKHMGTGLRGRKGRIHYSLGKPMTDELETLQNITVKNDQFSSLAGLIDDHIHNNYHLWENNYIAWDLLNQTSEHSDKYSAEEKNIFIAYINDHENRCNLNNNEDKEFIRTCLLEMYANPVGSKKINNQPYAPQ